MSEQIFVMSSSGLRMDYVGRLLETVNDCEGFITGSAIIGGFSCGSDIDAVFPIDRRCLVDDRLREKSLELGFVSEASEYNGGYKLIKDGSLTLNVVELHPFDYCAWLFATNLLKGNQPITDKPLRHRAFEFAVALFKLINTNSNYMTISGASAYYADNHDGSLVHEFATVVRLFQMRINNGN